MQFSVSSEFFSSIQSFETKSKRAPPIKTKLARMIEIVTRKYFRNSPELLLFATLNTPLVLSFELVTYAPNGFEFPLFGNAFKFFTKTLNVNVNGS